MSLRKLQPCTADLLSQIKVNISIIPPYILVSNFDCHVLFLKNKLMRSWIRSWLRWPTPVLKLRPWNSSTSIADYCQRYYTIIASCSFYNDKIENVTLSFFLLHPYKSLTSCRKVPAANKTTAIICHCQATAKPLPVDDIRVPAFRENEILIFGPALKKEH